MLVRYYPILVTKDHFATTDPIKSAIQEKYATGTVITKDGGIAVEFPNTVLTFGLDDDAINLKTILNSKRQPKAKVAMPQTIHLWRAFRNPPKVEEYDADGNLVPAIENNEMEQVSE